MSAPESDLARLQDLTLDSILQALKGRYEQDKIYTNVKDILIAVNPSKPLPIYDEAAHARYLKEQYGPDQEPHVFQVAAAAYSRLQQTDTDQVIIVSGESGAGKTESTKHMVKHLVHICQKDKMDLHQRVMDINPLLEAYGNAKTTLNHNSSRFAKFLEISFKEDGEIAGAVVRDYMLEKSRVVHQAPGEGIFHIFYALFAGCPPEMMTDLFLEEDYSRFRIMQSDISALGERSSHAKYKAMYSETMQVLQKIGVDREILHVMLAAVINISEIEFEENDRGVAQIKDAAPHMHSAMLLDLKDDELGGALIASSREIQGEKVATYKTVKEARAGRDALAKILYERMFGWLVRQINSNLHPNRLGTNIKASIGILDIAGFETLKENSFEQMCINIVNEKLQSFMNDRIFRMELEIYQNEGVELAGISFENNDEIVKMFDENKSGILALLDEVTGFRQGTDAAFAKQIKERFGGRPHFETTRKDDTFAIKHFAAQVEYNTSGFIEKNRDLLNRELMDVMRASQNGFISDLFTVKRGPTGTISATNANLRQSRKHIKVMTNLKQSVHLKKTPQGDELSRELGKSLARRFDKVQLPSAGISRIAPHKPQMTVVAYFRNSLLELISKLGTGEPFFVRCIKTNAFNIPNTFDGKLVENQLRYNGLAQVAKIRKEGFGVRRSYDDFISRYKPVISFVKWPAENKVIVQKIMMRLPSHLQKQYRSGKSLVFMTHEVLSALEHLFSIRRKQAYRKLRPLLPVIRAKGNEARIKKERERLEKERQEKERQEKERQEKERREKERREKELEQKREQERKAKELKGTKSDFGASLGRSIDDTDMPGPSTLGQSTIGGSTWGGSRHGGDSPTRLKQSIRFTGPNITPNSSTESSLRSNDYDEVPSPGRKFNAVTRETPPPQEEKAPEVRKEKQAFWDLPQIIVREQKIRDVHEDRGLQVIKVATYILIFLILLWCAVAHKIALMTLVAHQYPLYENQTESQIRDRAVVAAGKHMLLCLAILIPYSLIFLSSGLKWVFGRFMFPRISTLLLSCFTEVLHSVGLCILVFIILPELDIVRGILLLSGVAIVPAVLLPVCASDVKVSRDKEPKKRSPGAAFAILCCNVLAAIFQIGFIPLTLITDNFIETSEVDKNNSLIALFIVAMIFVSFSWWENFVDDRFCGKTNQRSCMKRTMLAIKYDLQESRPIVTFFTSCLKIGVTIAITYATKLTKPYTDSPNAEYHKIDTITLSEIGSKLGEVPVKDNGAIITLTLAAFVGYYIGYTACKLKLQRFSFNIPLLLSTPIAAILAAYDCSNDIFFPFTNELQTMCRGQQDDLVDLFFVYFVGAIALVSLYWICRYIFHPDIERLAKTERLFTNPFYCGILFEQNMILNRRRHNRKITMNLKDDKKPTFSLSEYNSQLNVEGEEVDNPIDIDDIIDRSNDQGCTRNHLGQTGRDNYKPEGLDDVHADKYRGKKFRDVPTIYACATMWHENKQEMVQLMKSLFRMDRDQSLRRAAELMSGKEDKDFYEFEAHIFFDDAMELDDDDEMVPNQFVRLLLTILNEAANSVYERNMKLKQMFIVPSPYGGQIILSMPGDNFLFIHLKDKQKIRHKKRWSQVMYMYFLLGYRIVRMNEDTVNQALESGRINELLGWQESSAEFGRSHIFHYFDEQVAKTAENTFLLALDGDVDFSPGAVRLLVDRMRKSEKVGAACGRIHPIGTGPVVWFQKFEYAIAHWLQKATEHVLGCVLCSPGCFSLFRGSALMDDNVMKKYTILPTSPVHHLMYDQGEDRWLCTLLLQQGYRVDYAAGSDAFTYAPEGFGEFFNQRRRWMPSTVFNIVDLLADYKNTVYVNSNISMLYIFYQAALLLSTVIGPATILMMIAGANLVVFRTNLIWSYVIAMVPAIFYFIMCFYTKTKTQLQVAEILTGVYAFVMMIVLVGTIVTAAKESVFHPSVIFIVFLMIAFAFSALLHPKEWSCVVFGLLYFILIPTGFLLLIIYSLANLHVVSWGTREVPKKKTKEEIEQEKKAAEEKAKKKKEKGFFGRFLPQFPTKELKDILNKMTDSQTKARALPDDSETVKLLKEMNENMAKLVQRQDGSPPPPPPPPPQPMTVQVEQQKDSQSAADTARVEHQPKSILRPTIRPDSLGDSKRLSLSFKDEPPKVIRDELKNPKWADIDELKGARKIEMVQEELTFWQDFVKKYLKPLDLSDQEKKETANGLLELRTNICIGMAITNLLWVAINFMFQLTSPTNIKLGDSESSVTGENLEEEEGLPDSESSTYNPISGLNVDVMGLMFVFFYLLILLIQFAGMIIHRWGTFQHLVSVTTLRNPFHIRTTSSERSKQDDDDIEQGGGSGKKKKPKPLEPDEAFRICEALLEEPEPDYDSASDDDSEEDWRVEEQLRQLSRTGHKIPGSERVGTTLGRSTRLLNRSKELRETLSQPLARSMRTIHNELQSTTGRYIRVEGREQQLATVQNLQIWKRDKSVAKRPLPPVKRRMNFGPGRQNLKIGNTIQNDRPHIEDDADRAEIHLQPIDPDEERIYETIGKQGTVGRQLGKKLRLYQQAKNVRFTEPTPSAARYDNHQTHAKRPLSDDLY